MNILLVFFSTLFFFTSSGYSFVLSEAALFQRCYLQVTSTRVKISSTIYKDVKAGRKTAVDACIETLKLSNFSAASNTTIGDTANVVAKNVLKTFHRLHTGWFYSKDFPTISLSGFNYDTKDLYDSSSPALYVTRSLFKPGTKASEIVTHPLNLTPIRSSMSLTTGPATSHTFADFVFTSPFKFAPFGELFGVQDSGDQIVSFPANPIEKPIRPAGSVNLFDTKGGGFLGTQAYRLLNTPALVTTGGEYKTDGGLKTHRVWGKAVFHDALCRSLPVLRDVDAEPFVDQSSPIPFRTSSSCTRCHASQDRVASVIRNMKILYVGLGDPSGVGELSLRGGNFTTFHTTDRPAEVGWPSVTDADFYRRPTNGTLYFRDYQGNLVNQNVANPMQLGEAISKLDDFYICLAKRYYNYFTGIDVKVEDLNINKTPLILSDLETQHRNTVEILGKNLKIHQNLQQLIREILELSQYRKSDFNSKEWN